MNQAYQYQQFPSEPSFNEQPQQQPIQTNIQMQDMGNYPQNQPYGNFVQNQPIVNHPQQGQMIGNYQMNNQQIPQQQYMIIPIKSSLQKLTEAQGIYIKQKFEAVEAITGCETENSYKVFQADMNGIQMGETPLFVCKEKSNCLQRQCLSGSMRAFHMEVNNENGMINNGQLVKTHFLTLERPFKCTFFCLERPIMSVSFRENGSNVFYGQIKNPFMCGELGCEVDDHNGNLKYVITGTCCQLGFICRGFPCQSCQEYIFDVKSPTGEVLTRIQKQSPGCLKAAFSNADNFAMGFPINSTPEEKALLMAAALFLDYMYFENKQQGRNHNFNGIKLQF